MAASSADFLRIAHQLRESIDLALEGYTRYDDDCPQHLADAIRHSLLAPGKRLRPLLVLMACQALNCDYRRALPAACAVEMVHTYSLIHDDLPAMDDDDMRRGRPTCHAAFGEATGILAGDALLAQAFEVLSSDISPAHTALACCRELAKTAGASALVGGQQDDLAGEFAVGDLQQLERIHRRKTGAMIKTSLVLGALIAQAAPSELTALRVYGERIGLAFQIVDDLLDIRASAATMGKRTGKDAEQGKMTFPKILGEEASWKRAQELIAEACESVACFGPSADGLVGLAQYVLERNH
ncbi:MAG: polyprenyl synthetase family protein [Planctomycetaceae bacterium]